MYGASDVSGNEQQIIYEHWAFKGIKHPTVFKIWWAKFNFGITYNNTTKMQH
jgi:hypothetical protein